MTDHDPHHGSARTPASTEEGPETSEDLSSSPAVSAAANRAEFLSFECPVCRPGSIISGAEHHAEMKRQWELLEEAADFAEDVGYTVMTDADRTEWAKALFCKLVAYLDGGKK